MGVIVGILDAAQQPRQGLLPIAHELPVPAVVGHPHQVLARLHPHQAGWAADAGQGHAGGVRSSHQALATGAVSSVVVHDRP